MSLLTKLDGLRQGFAALPGDVCHGWRPNLSIPCTVWAEEGSNALHADGCVAEQALSGTVDYYTKDDLDPMPDAIQEQMTRMGLAWELNSIQHEPETGVHHWEWVWEV